MLNDLQLRHFIRNTEQNFKQVAKDMNQLLRFKTIMEAEKKAEVLQKVLDKERAAGESYTKLIIAAGYAGFLTFWGKSAPEIPQPWHAAIGVMMLLSLFLFMTWEVFKSVWKGVVLHRASAALQKNQTPTGVDKFTKSIERFNRLSNRIWIAFLIPTIAFGFAGGLTLLAWFLRNLWLSIR